VLTGTVFFLNQAMEQVISTIVLAFFTGFIGWLFGRKKENVQVKSIDIDNEIKSAAWYQNLLDDAAKRLNEAIKAIEERDKRIRERDEKIEILIAEIEKRDKIIRERDEKTEQLIDEIEKLTEQLRKYKQLNGKS
jgi:uncharacterized protein (DUF3084 family)